jgi:hypothetical protein
MSAAAARKQAALRPSALEVFIARAEARALLWQAGQLDLYDAVDELQHTAVRDGLVAELGQDAVQEIMVAAFTTVRDDLNPYRTVPHESEITGADERQRRKPPDLHIEKLRELMADCDALDFFSSEDQPGTLQTFRLKPLSAFGRHLLQLDLLHHPVFGRWRSRSE